MLYGNVILMALMNPFLVRIVVESFASWNLTCSRSSLGMKVEKTHLNWTKSGITIVEASKCVFGENRA